MKKKKVQYLIAAITILVLLCFIILIAKKGSNSKEITVTYYYGARKDNSFDISITEKSFITKVKKEILREDLPVFENEIEFIGKYHIKVDDTTWFEFAYADADRIILSRNNEKIITQIDSEIIQRIANVVDQKLEANSKIFETDQITLTMDEKAINISEYSWIYRIKYITKEFTWKETNINVPTPFDTMIDFNNGTKLYLYKDDNGYFVSEGYLIEKDKVYEIYNLDLLSGVISEMEIISFE